MTYAEAAGRDIAEIENLTKGGPIAIADYLLVNDRDQAAFQSQLESIYKKLV
jgi:hypothetical protein